METIRLTVLTSGNKQVNRTFETFSPDTVREKRETYWTEICPGSVTGAKGTREVLFTAAEERRCDSDLRCSVFSQAGKLIAKDQVGKRWKTEVKGRHLRPYFDEKQGTKSWISREDKDLFKS